MFTKVTKVFKTVREKNAMSDGLAPIYVSPQTGVFTTGRVTFGALGDSYYEYLLKCWIQGGMTEDWLRDMVSLLFFFFFFFFDLVPNFDSSVLVFSFGIAHHYSFHYPPTTLNNSTTRP